MEYDEKKNKLRQNSAWAKRESELKVRNELKKTRILQLQDKGYFMCIRSLKVVSAMIVLECTMLTSYFTLVFRMSLLNKIG